MPRLKRVQHEIFCQEYVIDGHGANSAKRAGYSKKTAVIQASKLLTNPNIKQRITELMRAREKRTGIDADWVLTRLAQLAEFKLSDIYSDGDVINPEDMPERAQRAVTSIKQKDGCIEARMVDPLRVLELIGKHVKVGAFEENLNVSEFSSLGDRIRRAQKRMGIRGKPDDDE